MASRGLERSTHRRQLVPQFSVLRVEALYLHLGGLASVVQGLLLGGEPPHLLDQGLTAAVQRVIFRFEFPEPSLVGEVLLLLLLGEHGSGRHVERRYRSPEKAFRYACDAASAHARRSTTYQKCESACNAASTRSNPVAVSRSRVPGRK